MPLAKLLLVDDEEAFVDTMVRRLTKRGFETITAYSGQEALDTLEKNPDVDVVILDVKMPGMNGIEALKEIKARHPLVEVIMLTAHATVESALEGMKLGAFDYLMKPAEMQELVDKVKNAEAIKRHKDQKIVQAEALTRAYKKGE